MTNLVFNCLMKPLNLQRHHKENAQCRAGLAVILEDLKGNAGEKPGAFFCDYNIFKQIYQLQARSVRRTGLPSMLLYSPLPIDMATSPALPL